AEHRLESPDEVMRGQAGLRSEAADADRLLTGGPEPRAGPAQSFQAFPVQHGSRSFGLRAPPLKQTPEAPAPPGGGAPLLAGCGRPCETSLVFPAKRGSQRGITARTSATRDRVAGAPARVGPDSLHRRGRSRKDRRWSARARWDAPQSSSSTTITSFA